MRIWLLALLATGCIEGRDPDACHADADCDNGTVCSAIGQCDAPADLRTVTLRWTLDGAAPTPANCARTVGFLVGFDDELGDGFSVDATCTDGTTRTERVPDSYAIAQISAYDGTDRVIGMAKLAVPDGDNATVAVDVDLH